MDCISHRNDFIQCCIINVSECAIYFRYFSDTLSNLTCGTSCVIKLAEHFANETKRRFVFQFRTISELHNRCHIPKQLRKLLIVWLGPPNLPSSVVVAVTTPEWWKLTPPQLPLVCKSGQHWPWCQVFLTCNDECSISREHTPQQSQSHHLFLEANRCHPNQST